MFLLPALLGEASATDSSAYAGSKSCRECHARFYGLWSTSMHGLALQPYNQAFAREKFTPQRREIVIGKARYRAMTGQGEGWIVEQGKGGAKRYPLAYILGGKNVCYFLTPLAKGRLQTLPLAYDLNRREWFDTAASGLRHSPGGTTEAAIDWKSWPYTFNTSCYGCHVSQLASNYDLKSDSYATVWKEPGINCETCHGPCDAHNRVARATPQGEPLADPQLIRTKQFTPQQHNDACNACHSKAIVLTASYPPGERFFDHFDLVALESPDFYPDGRDLGENYTQTSWRMSPCVQGGQLHCVTCHTSSGRYRFRKPEEANQACCPCHEARVKAVVSHSQHPEGSTATRCVACHMPTTEFARMQRTDHSMLPPTPATTLAYGSPNACNGCHGDRDAAWADRQVRQWSTVDYQQPVLARAALIAAARQGEWSQLPAILAYLDSPQRNEIVSVSLLRLLNGSNDPARLPALRRALHDPSPLIRGAAVEALGRTPELGDLQELAAATGDESRLVRIRAAAALAQLTNIQPQGEAAAQVDRATTELLASLMTRPDRWDAHYNLGNYYLGKNQPQKALAEFDAALQREPEAVLALVNASLAHARLGQMKAAEERLTRALQIAPGNAAALYNLGLLKAEAGQLPAAAEHLQAALKADPQLDDAAYNLCILTAALTWCEQAVTLRPREGKYAYTLAFFQRQSGDVAAAMDTLDRLLASHPGFADAWFLLADIYRQAGKQEALAGLLDRAVATEQLPAPVRAEFGKQLAALRE